MCRHNYDKEFFRIIRFRIILEFFNLKKKQKYYQKNLLKVGFFITGVKPRHLP